MAHIPVCARFVQGGNLFKAVLNVVTPLEVIALVQGIFVLQIVGVVVKIQIRRNVAAVYLRAIVPVFAGHRKHIFCRVVIFSGAHTVMLAEAKGHPRRLHIAACVCYYTRHREARVMAANVKAVCLVVIIHPAHGGQAAVVNFAPVNVLKRHAAGTPEIIFVLAVRHNRVFERSPAWCG